MNRDHDVASATRVIDEVSHLTGLRSFNIDLIFGRPSQTTSAWIAELHEVFLRFPKVPHVSLYELTVEKGTPLYKEVRQGRVSLPTEEERATMYQETVQFLASLGLTRYEVSNFSREEKHRGRHNTCYWLGGQFLGVGPGAHGRYFLDGIRHASIQAPAPQQWMSAVERSGHGTRILKPQGTYDVVSERLVTSLRTIWGFKAKDDTNISLRDLVHDEGACASFVKDGLLHVTDERLSLSDEGLMLADYISPFLLSRLKDQLEERRIY